MPKPAPTALEVPNAVVVAEFRSPSGKMRDLKEKVTNYALVRSIAHYFIFDPADAIMLHHTKATMVPGEELRRVA